MIIAITIFVNTMNILAENVRQPQRVTGERKGPIIATNSDGEGQVNYVNIVCRVTDFFFTILLHRIHKYHQPGPRYGDFHY